MIVCRHEDSEEKYKFTVVLEAQEIYEFERYMQDIAEGPEGALAEAISYGMN
jgi:hypothetical protein